ncbi:MAG: ABC transporter permease [Nocardioidaceae bacterium]
MAGGTRTEARARTAAQPAEQPGLWRSVRPWAYGIAGVIGVLIVWAIIARYFAGTVGTIQRLAPPTEVAGKIASYVTGTFGIDVWSSFKVFLGGWLGGGISATLIGLLLGRVRVAGQMFIPIIEALRPVSSIVWVPLSVVWFGFGYTSKVFVVGLAVFLVVIVYAVDGCARIPTDVQRTATMLGMTSVQRFRSVILPATLGEVLVGLRVALMAGWGTVIVAELVAADTGLGAHLIYSQQSYDIAEVMATMVCFAVTGFVMNSLLSVAQRRLLPWQQG